MQSCFGSVAQLVQSVCLTSRGSGVRIPPLPPLQRKYLSSSLERYFLFIVLLLWTECVPILRPMAFSKLRPDFKLEKFHYQSFILLMVCGCSTIKYVPIETDKEVKVITETVYRDTVIFRDLPKESHSQMTVDTSRVETSLAESTAYIDTATNMINHSI